MTIDDENDRFWAKVQKGPQCWGWLGGKQTNGYGTMTANGNRWLAHRFSWRLHNGDIPEGLVICHTCDNRVCVRPDHLFVGTVQDNNSDMVAKGRHARGSTHGTVTMPHRYPAARLPRGERVHSAKLTESQVLELRRRKAEAGATYESLASEFGLSKSNVWNIVQRRTWAHLDSNGDRTRSTQNAQH